MKSYGGDGYNMCYIETNRDINFYKVKMIAFRMVKVGREGRELVSKRLKFVNDKLAHLIVALRDVEEHCIPHPQKDYQRLMINVYDSRKDKLEERKKIYEDFLRGAS